MKSFGSPEKDTLYFMFRMVNPIINPIKFFSGLYGYFWYLRDAWRFNQLSKDTQNKVEFGLNLYPVLDEKISYTPFDSHYFHQQLWTFEKILQKKPEKHVDVASTYEMSGYISKITKAIFVDIRPINVELKNLEAVKGDILNLPFEDQSLESVSCLNVIEHIGLGRYGDPIDPEGIKKACKELQRVVAKGGSLYLSTPIGKERLCFNAHRVSDPDKITDWFDELELKEFTAVDDTGKLISNTSTELYKQAIYSCGFYEFCRM